MDYENPLNLSPKVVQEMRQYMAQNSPFEACGIIAEGKFIPKANIAQNRRDFFEICPSAWAEHDIQGVVHSHCPPCTKEPTATDMESQIRSGVPWAVVHVRNGHAEKPLWWGDYRLAAPLIGRKFIWCVQDCYTLVRSEEFQRTGVIVPDEPRDPEWKSDVIGVAETSKMYQHLPGSAKRQNGDVVCMRIQHKFIDHFGIQMPDGQMLHHMVDQYSITTPITRYEPFIQQIWRLRPEVREQLRQQQQVRNAA